jgi:iron complex transport system substrate-binding protein
MKRNLSWMAKMFGVAVFFVLVSAQVFAQTAATRTVTDMAGRRVTLPVNIEKIATFGSVGVLNAFVELMGDGHKIIHDMPPSFTRNSNWKMQYEFAPQIKGAPVFEDANREILIEVVVKNKPDVCIVMSRGSIDILEKNGLPVIFLSWTKPEDIKQAVTLMGAVLNKQSTATKYIAYFDEMVSRAQKLSSTIKEADKKKVLYTSLTDLSQPHLVAEWWIKLAGGISVTDNGRTAETMTYTLEDMLRWNPDVMVVTAAQQINEARADRRFAGITAVKNNSFYVTPTVAHVWGNRTVEQPLTIFWMMHKLYPNVVSNATLAQEIKRFYHDFFLYDMSDSQVSEIIGAR